MPTLPAAGYTTPQAPSVATPPDAATPYQSGAGATAAAFGGGSATALGQLGTSAEQAAGHLVNIQNMFNAVAADDQTNKAEDKINKLLYGDVDAPGPKVDTGLFGKRGEEALHAYPVVRKQIDQIIQEHRAVLQNLPQQLHFDQQTRQFRNYALTEAGRHYDRQLTQHENEVAAGRATLNLGKIAGAAASGDQAAFETFVGKAMADTERDNAVRGKPPEIIDAEKQKLRQHAARSWAEGLAARGDAFGADAFADRNREILGDQYDNLKREFHTRVKEQQIQNAVDGKPVMVRGGATENIMSGDLWGRIKFAEGGVGAGGEARTSPKGAIGVSQILPDTAEGMARELGLPFDKERLYTDQKYNETLGKAYLDKMLNHYSGNETLASAAYNAGPGRVDSWLKTIGDPRKGEITNEAFAGRIPIAETRNYVGKIAAGGGARTVPTAPAENTMVPPPPDPASRPDSAVPGLVDKLAELDRRAKAEGWPADVYRGAYSLARERLNAAYTDEQRALHAQKIANDKVVQSAENEIIADHYSEVPKITAQQVSQDKRFDSDPSARLRMLNLLKPDRGAVDAATSSTTMHELMRQITNGTITDRAPIFDAFNAQPSRLSDHHLNFLLKQLEDVRTPEGLRINQEINLLLESVKPLITKPDPLTNLPDPYGTLQFGAFAGNVRAEVERMRKDKKTPAEISEYLSVNRYRKHPELLTDYQTTQQERIRQLVKPPSGAPSAGTVQPAAPEGPPVAIAPIPPLGATVPSGVVPRQPGESAADYMKRIGR